MIKIRYKDKGPWGITRFLLYGCLFVDRKSKQNKSKQIIICKNNSGLENQGTKVEFKNIELQHAFSTSIKDNKIKNIGSHVADLLVKSK